MREVAFDLGETCVFADDGVVFVQKGVAFQIESLVDVRILDEPDDGACACDRSRRVYDERNDKLSVRKRLKPTQVHVRIHVRDFEQVTVDFCFVV